MILCNKNCRPCCGFCIYAEHETFEAEDVDGIHYVLRGAPSKCKRFNDQDHDNLAANYMFCNEFYCMNAQWLNKWYNIGKEDWENEMVT